jgi:uncharacterized protein
VISPTHASAPSSTLSSGLYVGWVRHRRHRPSRHAFRHRTYHVLLDVDELPVLERRLRGLFRHGGAALTSFHDTDHFGPLDAPVREKLSAWLATQGVALPGGRVQVLANLRVLGHVFNPVSWWFCHHPDGRLAFVVAEVHNTFGEAHAYLLDELEHRPDGTVRAQARKVFHVSPFLPVEGLGYRFVFTPPGGIEGERLLAHLDVDDDEGRLLDATQYGRRVPLTGRNLAVTLLRNPLLPLRTVVLIHLHALVLGVKRVGFHRKPAPPPDGFPRRRAARRPGPSRRGSHGARGARGAQEHAA